MHFINIFVLEGTRKTKGWEYTPQVYYTATPVRSQNYNIIKQTLKSKFMFTQIQKRHHIRMMTFCTKENMNLEYY